MALVQLLLCIIYLYKNYLFIINSMEHHITTRENCPIVKKLFCMSNCGCVSCLKVVDETFLLIFLLGASALSSNTVLSMQVLSVV